MQRLTDLDRIRDLLAREGSLTIGQLAARLSRSTTYAHSLTEWAERDGAVQVSWAKRVGERLVQLLPELPPRIQRKRQKGWRAPGGAVYVGRPTRWGNPFTAENCLEAGCARTTAGAKAICARAFADWLTLGPGSRWWFESGRQQWDWMHEHLPDLRGRPLMCWCRLEEPCHADALLKAANQGERAK